MKNIILLLLFLMSKNGLARKPNAFIFENKITKNVYALFRKTLSETPPKTKFFILFNSTGGHTVSALYIIENIILAKQKGVRFECYLFIAGSAAASIFAECDDRHVFKNSMLMQHRGGYLSGEKCVWICQQLDKIRLQTESKNQGISVKAWLKQLPKINSFLKFKGKQIYIRGLGTTYYDFNLNLNKALGR